MERYEYLWLLNGKIRLSVTVEWKNKNICDCWMEKLTLHMPKYDFDYVYQKKN
jgi:hypothetical protein